MESLLAFKVRRDGTDRTGIRTAVKRLEEGRVVGVFPEGGIRAGKGSVLEGAQMWPGASALAVLSGKPIVPASSLDPIDYTINETGSGSAVFQSGLALVKKSRLEAISQSETHAIWFKTSLSEAFVLLKERMVIEFGLAPDRFADNASSQKTGGLSPLIAQELA